MVRESIRNTMKTFPIFKTLWIALLLLFTVVRAGEAQRGSSFPNRTQIVLVKALNAAVNMSALADGYQATLLERVPGSDVYVLAAPRGQTSVQFADALSANEINRRLVFAEPDIPVETPETRAIRNSTRKQMPLAFDGGKNPSAYLGQSGLAQADLGDAHTYTKGHGVIVAILDTGATFNHPLLQGHYLPGYNALIPNRPPLDVPDGRTNYAVGHGTMMAGIVAEIAPGAMLLPVRVLNADGQGTILSVVKGIYYAIGQGAHILNMSFGAKTTSGALNDALDAAEQANIILVAASGNDGGDIRQYPAHGRGTWSIASLESNNVKSDFSNYGGDILFCAPGRDIWSTYWNGGYASWSGTSFSVPFVVGQAALLKSLNPTMTGDSIKRLIRDTAHDVSPLNPRFKLGAGLIDIAASVHLAL